MHLTINTMFHSVIFSISENVPSIAVTYGGNKGDGIMRDLELNEYSIPIEKITSGALIEAFVLLQKNDESLRHKMRDFGYRFFEEREKLTKSLVGVYLTVNK